MKVEMLKNITWHDTKKRSAKVGEIVEISPELNEVWKKQEICKVPTKTKRAPKTKS